MFIDRKTIGSRYNLVVYILKRTILIIYCSFSEQFEVNCCTHCSNTVGEWVGMYISKCKVTGSIPIGNQQDFS